MQAARWAIAVSVTIIVGAITWAVAAAGAHLDTPTAVGVVAILTTLAGLPLTAWANRADTTNPVPSPVSLPLPRTAPDPVSPDEPILARQTRHMPGEAVQFQDRGDEMDRLAVMAVTGETVVVCALAGQRGIGKTQLAAAYARDRIRAGWPVVVWIVAETANGIADEFATLAQAVGLAPPGTDTVDAAGAGLAWLGNHPGPCLLVFDNAVDPDVIRQWIPPTGHVQTVVTTTQREFANLGVLLDVGLFTTQQVVTYMRARTGLADDTGAASLAEQLGRLPLALAAAIIGPGRRHPTYEHYLNQLDALDLDRLLPHTTGDPYPHGAAQAIMLALDDLGRDDPGGYGRRLLECLAVLSPIGVDSLLLRHLLVYPPPTGRIGWLITRWRRANRTPVDVAMVVPNLAQRSLTLPTRGADQVVVHRLVQRAVRDHCRHEGRLGGAIYRRGQRNRRRCERDRRPMGRPNPGRGLRRTPSDPRRPSGRSS